MYRHCHYHLSIKFIIIICVNGVIVMYIDYVIICVKLVIIYHSVMYS